MYDDIVSKLLQKAEFLYGKRVPGFIIDGVEIDDEKAPCIYYPFNNNHVIILRNYILYCTKDFV